jgi:ribosomal protein S18 acetylase RimI-like enzyme
MKIEPISEAYLSSLCDAIYDVAREEKYLAMTAAVPISEVIEFQKKIISNKLPQFVAIENDKVIGWCDILPKKTIGFTHVASLGMGIISNFRNQGIGNQLLSKTISKVKEIGIEKVELDVFESNQNAIDFYLAFGFKKEGLKIKARKYKNEYDNVLLMGMVI